eukprot:5536083-Amphidinium_carterae.2
MAKCLMGQNPLKPSWARPTENFQTRLKTTNKEGQKPIAFLRRGIFASTESLDSDVVKDVGLASCTNIK